VALRTERTDPEKDDQLAEAQARIEALEAAAADAERARQPLAPN
jgi:hypothetical protein